MENLSQIIEKWRIFFFSTVERISFTDNQFSPQQEYWLSQFLHEVNAIRELEKRVWKSQFKDSVNISHYDPDLFF